MPPPPPQVLMSYGLASGHVYWGGQRFDFQNAACYAEKNWGGGFPSRWSWAQCNTFEGWVPGVLGAVQHL